MKFFHTVGVLTICQMDKWLMWSENDVCMNNRWKLSGCWPYDCANRLIGPSFAYIAQTLDLFIRFFFSNRHVAKLLPVSIHLFFLFQWLFAYRCVEKTESYNLSGTLLFYFIITAENLCYFSKKSRFFKEYYNNTQNNKHLLRKRWLNHVINLKNLKFIQSLTLGTWKKSGNP